MSNKLFKAVAVILVCVISCKKSNNGTTTIDLNALLVGKWTLDSTAYDANGNGKIDAGETSKFSSGTQTNTYTSNGKLFDTGYYGGTTGIFQQYSWSIVNSNYLLTKSLDTGAYFGSTYSYRIDNPSLSQVKLFDTSAHTWYIYKK
jgi:hypothetical protein